MSGLSGNHQQQTCFSFQILRMRNTNQVIIGILIIITTVQNTVESIKCLQCWSVVDYSCERGHEEAKECKGPHDKYCIKYVGMTWPGMMVFRDCSRTKIDKMCTIKVIEGHSIKVCYETCSTDGCNAGPAYNTASNTKGSLIYFLYLFILRYLI